MNRLCFIPICLLFCSCFISCYDEANSYGENLVNSVFRNVSVDSCTVSVSSSLMDSLETNGQGVALIGRYTHPVWGTVTSLAYLPYTAPSYGTDIDETVVLDSLVLLLKYDGYALGDTNQFQTFTVHRLREKVVLNSNDYLYNSSSFAYEAHPIASCTFRPGSGESEDVEVRLPDDLGQDMLERLHRRDLSVESDRFEDYFNGLVVVPDAQNCQTMMSFSVGDTASALILRYHLVDELAEAQECVINPNTSTQFYHVDHDRTGTALQGLPAKGVEVTSEEIGNRGFLFGGIGWYTRLKFPYLNNILQQGKRVSIESAYLKIYPESGTYSEYNSLPDSIFLYITDENNVVTDAVKDYLGEEVQGGSLVKDDTFDENTYYYFDVTDFMQQELGAFGMYKHNLQLVFAEDAYTKTFRNLTVCDQHGRSPIVLQLIYKVYESY